MAFSLVSVDRFIDEFSYASATDSLPKVLLIRAIELLSGQPKLKGLYQAWQAEGRPDIEFFGRAIDKLELDLSIKGTGRNSIPRDGPLVVVANHPYGVLDGIVMCWLIAQARPDFKILINSVLCRIPEIADHVLPVNFEPTEDALQTNLASRRAARATLEAGGCLVVFPAGGVSTTPTLLRRRAEDAAWAPLTGQLIRRSAASVLPIYFGGQNSTLFQVVSHFSMTVRQALLFHEVHRRMGTKFEMVIGEALPFDAIAEQLPPPNLVQYLQRHTHALGEKITKLA